MIPYASQRAEGQDLATHLMNEEDNEYMEVAEVRGAIAQDLHGAFAEWEAQARALTKCENYLYSLSINPDETQRRLTREEYFTYIDAAEKKLGLEGQPRAVVFHIKEDKTGELREHCHVVWSRIDAWQGKAVHMPFDHEKLMMVTRQFAHDHELKLPDGYFRDNGEPPRHHQKYLHERRQEQVTGLSKEERMALITNAWRSSDSAKAFVRALEESGFILARGRRPYLVVDIYGKESALPRMIDNRSVRAEDVVRRLEEDFPPESLPTVEEAKALAAEHRKAREDSAKASLKAEELTRLKERQAERRQKIEADVEKEERRQAREFSDLKECHQRERAEARDAYLAEVRRIRTERREYEPKGFPGFLSRLTGITRIREMIQRQRDKKLYDIFIADRLDLRERQEGEERALQHRHHLQKLDLDRRLRALGRIEERERQSLDTKKLAEQRTKQRGSREQMPAISLELKPKGRPAAPYKAKNRYISEHREKSKRRLTKAEITEKAKKRSLTDEFDRVYGEGRTEGEDSGVAAGPKPVSEKKARRQRVRKQETNIELSEEFRRAAGEGQRASGGDDGKAQAPKKRERRPRDADRPRRQRKPRDRGPDRGM